MKWMMGDRCGWVCHGLACLTMACAAAVADAEDLKAVEEVQQAKKVQDAQQAQKQAVEKQRQQQIDQHAKHMQTMVMPTLQAELELVRKTCGSLPSEARKKIVAAGNAAVQTAARQVSERQMGGHGAGVLDTRKMIRDAVAAAVKPHATAEEFAAYEREQAARIARRNRAARLLIVNKVDGEIQLSQAQREKIEADLENRWDAKWLQALHDTGGTINNRPPAPDYADKCIAPHLDERQRADWKAWCDQAGASRHGRHYGWDFDGQGMQPDPWWSR